MKKINFDSLTELEKKVLRWDSDFCKNEHEHLEKNILRSFHVLWGKYDLFAELIFENFPKNRNDFDFDKTITDKLSNIFKIRKDKVFKSFLVYLQRASHDHGCILNIQKKGDHQIEYGFHHGGSTLDRSFRINGHKIKIINRKNKESHGEKGDKKEVLLPCGGKVSPLWLLCRQQCEISPCYPSTCTNAKFDPDYYRTPPIIEINDVTNKSEIKKGACSQIMRILAETETRIPHILKYSHPNYGKRFLLCIPGEENITELVRTYIKGISRSHRDFYQKNFRGRPESKFYQKDLILDVLEEYKGKRFSINKLCQLASEKLKQREEINLSPSTIRRHYLNEIKSIRDAKNSQ